ncbi:MAG TPA: ABC transporter ATP-binding protein [Bryobacteraceae bacterium]|nr:ABC transporter ATP-binding protein [Bryobacteraceae bacterium]
MWPASRLGEVAHALVRAGSPLLGTPPEKDLDSLGRWLESAAAHMGFEAQPTETTYSEFEHDFARLGPAIVHIPTESGPAFLAILAGGKILPPAGGKQNADAAAIRSAICSDAEEPILREIQEMLDRAKIPAANQTRAREAILRERLGAKRIRGIWLLRLPPGADFWQQLRHARIPRRLAALASAHSVQYLLWILAWYIVGSNVLRGDGDRGWLIPWALLLLTLVPLRVLITRLQGSVAIGAGALLKQRLFLGSLRLDPDSLRHQGAGQLLGRVLESEAVEALALSGGFLALVALIEIIAAIFVLAAGAGGLLQSGLLLVWLGIAAWMAWRYFQRNLEWTDVRLALTHDLVENMAGHRTRLAQLAADRWHDGEDEALENYLKNSRTLDESTVRLLALIPRGWLVLGLLGMAPALLYGAPSPARIAIAVGGTLLAYRAWRRLTSGAWQLAGAAVAWQRTSVLFRSAARHELPGALDVPPSEPAPPVVDARDIVFRYGDRTRAVLDGANLQVAMGDRLVLEGSSGGGKSTLVSLLAGVREANSGRVLIGGHDRATLGAAEWRRRLAAAPQFHENHVLAETFAFNLFLGHPAVLTPDDFAAAEAICHELGLGDLLARMPAGMLQMVGETGWQLSHGERSRLYIARALLQDADLVILDESFAALDPENLKRAVECVAKRARSLLVIAHR